MVAVVGGNGLGLFNTSLNTLGGAGVLGQGRQGLYGGSAYVNAVNGNLILQALDEQLSGRGIDLGQLRTYNAQGQLDDGDGDGWRWDGEQRIVVSGSNGQVGTTVTRIGSDGHATVYAWDATQARYLSNEGEGAHDSFVYDAAQLQWVWTEANTRTVERYTASTRRLASITDGSGNRIDTLYDANGRLSQVVDAGSGQRLVLTYATVAGTSLTRLSKVETRSLTVDASGRATATLGALVKQVDYGYDSLGRLTSVKTDLTPENTTDSRFYVTGYTYDGASYRVASILQGDGTAAGTAYASFTYEQIGTTGAYRVKTVTDAGGTQSFDYSVANQTTLTDGNGQVWRYVYDSQQRLTQIQRPSPTTGGAALTTSFAYDSAGNVISVTDATGKTTSYAYDAQGNRTLERDALGNTVTWTYNAQNQVETRTRYRVADPDGAGTGQPSDAETVRYVYDAKSRLRFVVSAEGYVSEQRYVDGGTVYGQLERSLQYTNNRYDVSGLSTTQGLTEAQLTMWLSLLSAVDRSQAQMSQYTYDLRGNLSKRTDYATLNAATGDGVLDATATVTESIYDGHGRLLQTIAVRGSARDQRTTLTSMTYDGMGRELTVLNASGSSSNVYDDLNRRIAVTNSTSGLSTQQAFDAMGRLLSVVQSAGGSNRATQYVYDSAGRLRMQVRAGASLTGSDGVGSGDDLRSFNFYDSAGRLQYTVDATGAVTGMTYDANGRMKQQTQYLNRVDTSGWYSPSTGVVSKTVLTVGAAGSGSDVVVDAANDRSTRYDYDDAGRLIRQIDAANTVTTTVYDGTSRVMQQQTGDRITRFFYDRDGRQVGVLDPLGYLIETRYDGAGRVVETIRYQSASTNPALVNTSAPMWLGVTNTTVSGNQLFEHRLPAAYDPDGDAIAYSVVGTLPSWLSFDAASLTLRGKPPAALTSYSVTLRASDQRGTPPKTTDVTVQITVANSAPSWAVLSDQAVAVNATNYILVLPVATDTTSTAAQLTYSIPAALLPPGMSFNATTRTLSGTPTTAGSYTITARVTDPQGAYTERSFVLTVTNAGPRWAAVALQQGRVNTAFSFTVPVATDPNGQILTYSAVSLPAGLSFSINMAGQPVISGTPIAPSPRTQPYSIVLKATDPAGEEVRLAFGLEVRNDPPGGNGWGGTQVLTLQPVMSGTLYSFTPVAPVDPEGQTLSYAVTEGNLPPGMSVNAVTGEIRGNSTAAGTYQWVITARDPHGEPVSQSFKLTVLNAPPVYNGGLQNVTATGPRFQSVYVSFSIPVGAFTDLNGDALSYSVSEPWLSFDASSNTFGGYTTIAANSTETVTVTARDPSGAAASGSFQLSLQVGAAVSQGVAAIRLDGAAALASPAPEASAQLSLPPIVDPLADWRPSNTAGLRSYVYYDGQGRVTGTVDERGFVSETVYDAHGNTQRSVQYLTAVTVDAATDTLASVKTRAGASQATTSAFDGFGRVSTVTGVDGTVSRNVYDSAGRLVRQIAAEGTSEQRASRTRYNAFGEVTGTLGGVGDASLSASPTQAQIDTAIAGYGMRYDYDSFGRQVKATDANGNASWFYYDSENRLSHTVNVMGEVSATAYTVFGQVASVRRYATRLTAAQMATLTGGFAGSAFTGLLTADDANDALSVYDYEQRGLLRTQTLKRSTQSAEDVVTSNTYTQYGQLQTQTRTIAAGRTTVSQFGYDLRGALRTQTADVGGINLNQQLRYDAFGRVIEQRDGAGNLTSTQYNDNGRTIVVNVTVADGLTGAVTRSVQTGYDAFGRVLSVVDANGKTTMYVYDDVARSMSVTTPEGIAVTTVRNRHGQTLTVTDGRGGLTRYDYDKNGQPTTVTDALNRIVSQTAYDNSGRISQVTDARGTVTTLEYDAVNRVMVRTVDAGGLNLRTRYEYDAQGRQRRVTEGEGSATPLVTAFVYDRMGQLKQTVVDPDGLKLSTTYSFDGIGNTIKVERGTVDAPSQEVTRFEFDNLGRRVKSIAELREPLTNGGTAMRELTTEYRYDVAGRLSRTIDALGNSTWYVYDTAGQLRQTINALGEVEETIYAMSGRVEQTRRYATRLGGATLAGLGDTAGMQSPGVNVADRRTVWVYDKDGRQRFTLQASNGSDWSVREQRYDANGNVIETLGYDKPLTEARVTAILAGGAEVLEVVDELTRPTTAVPPGLGYVDEASLARTQRTRYAYDANNRLRFTVDALGGVSETVYDNGGLVLAQVRYATRPTLTGYTESAIDTAVNRTDANNQVVRMAYDKAGRLRYTVRELERDTLGVPTRHVVSRQDYDALGRVVQTIAYATELGTVADYRETTLRDTLSASAQDRRSAMVYDSAGRSVYQLRASVLDGGGAATRHVVVKSDYDAMGRALQVTAYATEIGALAAYTTEAVAEAVRLAGTSVRDRRTEFVYDSVGRQRFVIAADGGLSETVYDAQGQMREHRQFALTVDKATAWTEATLMTRRGGRIVGDGLTRGRHYDYDNVGRVLSTTDALGYRESWTYTALGEKKTYTNQNGDTWNYGYDRLGRMVRHTAPAVLLQLSDQTTPSVQSMVTFLEYNVFGELRRQIEAYQTADARETKYDYDRLGRQIMMTEPGWYDPATGQVYTTSATGRFQRTTQTIFDAMGQAVSTKTRVGAGASDFVFAYQSYDTLGRLSHAVDALGGVSGYTYTVFGEQKTATRYSLTVGAVPARGYWLKSELAVQMAADTQSRTVASAYDNLGRRTEVRGPVVARYSGGTSAGVNPASAATVDAAAVTAYDYTVFGELKREAVQVDSTRWKETWHYYDAAGREVRSVDALGHHTVRSYDATGNLRETVEYARQGVLGSADPAPPTLPDESTEDRITAFEYDARDQLRTVQRKGLRYSQWNGSAYVQVNAAREVAMTLQTMTYDGLGKIKTQADALGNTTTTVYNALGQVLSVTEVPRAVGRTGDAGSPDPFRNQVQATVETSLLYDGYGRVIELTKRASGQAVLLSQRNYFDVAGRLIASSGSDGTKSLAYDYAGRLIRETTVAGDSSFADWGVAAQTLEKRYAYDVLGRRVAELQVYQAGTQQSGMRQSYNIFGEVTQEQQVWGTAATAVGSLNAATVASYEYDRAGQMISKQAGDGKTAYYYNHAGQTTRVEQRGNENENDGIRSRVSETGYDVLGRAVIQRLPSFAALINASAQTTEAVTPVLEQSYDRWGNVIERAQGGYARHADGQPRNEQRTVTRYAYNAENQVISEELPVTAAWRENGTSYQAKVSHVLRYDVFGRVVEELDLADDIGTAVVEQTQLRRRSREYDSAGLLRVETDATGIRTEYAYDALGRRIGTRNAEGTVFVEAYNGRGQSISRSVLRLTDGGRYDSRNSQHLDANIVTHTLIGHYYDDAGRRTRTTTYDQGSALTARTEYALYDERGLLLAIREPGGAQTTYAYDAFGRKTEQRINGRLLQSWSYDAGPYTVGRLTGSVQSSGLSTGFGYDEFGQVIQEGYNAGTAGSKTYTYHDNGQLRQRTDTYRRGTEGGVGGADYYSSTETTQYDYTVQNQQARETFSRSGQRDVSVYDTEQRIWMIETQDLSGLSRSLRTAYDAQGRALELRSENPDSGAKLELLTYRYDELGNKRAIQVQYLRTQGAALESSNKWFAYDREGRMTVIDGGLINGAIVGGTALSYDALGRRAGMEKLSGVRSGTDPETGTFYVWKEYREERYAYNDLGHLIKVSQRLNRREMTSTRPGQSPQPMVDDPGEWYDDSLRTVDDRGTVHAYTQYGEVSSLSWQQDRVPKLKSVIASTYRLDGRLIGQIVTAYKADGTIDQTLSSRNLDYIYDADGKLRSYLYQQGVGTSEYFYNSYSYDYAAVFGADRESQITVTTNRAGSPPVGQTVSEYDHRGRMVRQRVDQSDELRVRLFSYDGEGRVLVQEEELRKTNGTISRGRDDFFYAQGEEVAAIGSGTLVSATRFSNGYTPISSAYPAASPTSYTVQHGDTLAAIAQTVFGDSALWYLIADANGLNAGPADALAASEEGRSLRIPNMVGNLHHNAGTFQPYNPGQIFGDATPTPTISRHQCVSEQTAWMVQALTTVITTVATAIMTAYLGPLGAIAGGTLGGVINGAVRQGMAMGNGQQKSFNWNALAVDGTASAVVSGFGLIGSGPGASFASQAAGGLANYSVNEAVAYARTSPEQRDFNPKRFVAGAVQSLAGTAMGRLKGMTNTINSTINAQASFVVSAALGDKPNFAHAVRDYALSQLAGFLGRKAHDAINPPSQKEERRQNANQLSLAEQVTAALAPMVNRVGEMASRVAGWADTLIDDAHEWAMEKIDEAQAIEEARLAAQQGEVDAEFVERIRGRAYEVQPGDNMFAIMDKFHGKGHRNLAIPTAVRNGLKNPGLIRPGKILYMLNPDDVDRGMSVKMTHDYLQDLADERARQALEKEAQAQRSAALKSQTYVSEGLFFDGEKILDQENVVSNVNQGEEFKHRLPANEQPDEVASEVVIINEIMGITSAERLRRSGNPRHGVMKFNRYKDYLRRTDPWVNPNDQLEMAERFMKYRQMRSEQIDLGFSLMDGYSMVAKGGAGFVLVTGALMPVAASAVLAPVATGASWLAGYGAEKVVTKVTGSEVAGMAAGLAGGVLVEGRLLKYAVDDVLRQVIRSRIRMGTSAATTNQFSPVLGEMTALEMQAVRATEGASASAVTNSGRAKEIISTAKAGELTDLLPESSLTKRQAEIHAALSEPGAFATFHKRQVSMSDLQKIGQVTGDEYSMFTRGSRRLILRGNGNEVAVSAEMYDDLLKGVYGRWSGHTHPPGYTLMPGPADRPFLASMNQRASSIWGDGGFYLFGRNGLVEDEMLRSDAVRKMWTRLFGQP